MKAAILEEIGNPLVVRDLQTVFGNGHIFVNEAGLSDGQVLVYMLTSGICGAQLQEIDGTKGNPSYCPHLLGHEGCGKVVGSRYDSHLKVGDKVVIHWRKGEGKESQLFPVLGEVRGGHCTTFSEYTIVSENRVTVIPSDVPNDLGALLGCCLSTALATVENIAKIKDGERVLIIGAGGLGLAMILAAKIAGASQIVCSDKFESKKDLALKMGATFFLPAWWQGDYAITLSNPSGMGPQSFYEHFYDVIINTATESSPYDYLLAENGRYIYMIGPKKNSEGGDFNPTKDIPRYIQMWRDGKLDGWENIITHRITLDQINDGIAAMRKGQTGRVMIDFT